MTRTWLSADPRGFSCTRRIARYKFSLRLRREPRETVSGRVPFGSNFLFALEKGHETAVSHSPGLPASTRSDTPGISEYVYRKRATPSFALLQPPRPEVSGLLSVLAEMAGVTRRGTKENFHLPPATETGSPVVATQRARQERNERFIFQKGARA